MRNALSSVVIGVAALALLAAGCWGPNINKDLDRVERFPKRFDPIVFNADTLLKQVQLAKGDVSKIELIAETAGAKIRVIKANGDLRLQVHKRHDQVLFVLQGEGVIEIDGIRDVVSGKPPVAREGTLIVVPRRKKYRFINTGQQSLTVVSVLVPSSNGRDTKFIKVKKKKKTRSADRPPKAK